MTFQEIWFVAPKINVIITIFISPCFFLFMLKTNILDNFDLILICSFRFKLTNNFPLSLKIYLNKIKKACSPKFREYGGPIMSPLRICMLRCKKYSPKDVYHVDYSKLVDLHVWVT